MNRDSRIYVAGHRGLVGSAIVRRLRRDGHTNLILRTRDELNLLDQAAVRRFFSEERIDAVYLAAAKVGGIYANSTQQADFLYENVVLAANVIGAAAETGTEKLLFLGSSCIYPKLAPQPISEESLLSGPLESTNEGYAIAKIVGVKLTEMYQRQYGKRFISAMPTNLYGPGDNFHPMNSHVIPGMLRRFHEARLRDDSEVVVWGTGSPKREFLHVDDLADALVLLMERYEEPTLINVGSGVEHTIAKLAEAMKQTVGFKGAIRFDPSKPDGTPRKVMDSHRMAALGWKPRYELAEGLRLTYEWALKENVFDTAGADAAALVSDRA
ncbi:MAG TPA: GDP-L-fucose synthase [Thermoanaerobaculia bacterium]|nr:GDP-L-fucose synthase [Thermoanaerobaculia bacterium]